MAKGLNTILLITRDRLVRADLARGGGVAPAGLHEERRPAVDDVPSLVEAALRLSARPPGRVWVLSSDFWTQTLTLAPEAIGGLRQEEISRSLAFEAETFSGISALEAVAASIPLPDRDRQRAFWLTELPAAQLEQIEYAVSQAGGRLMGVSHPGGLPRPFAAQAFRDDAWRRVELWPGAIVTVQGGGGSRPTVVVRNTDPKPDRWEADLERWRAEQPPVAIEESLHATSGVALAELAPQNRLSLEEPAGLQQFLEAWGGQLSITASSLPVVGVPKRPMAASSRRSLAAVLGLLALLICVAVHLASERRRNQLTEETARLREPASEMAKLKKEADALQASQAQLTKTCQKLSEDLSHYHRVMRSQRQRLATLLSVLARDSSDLMVIRKIDGTEDEIVLHGVCLRPEVTSALAAALARALGPQGWQVQPPTRQSREVLVGGGPWEFELRIKEPAAQPQGNSAPASAVSRSSGVKQP